MKNDKHLELWNSVFHTDPRHTKEVKFGRKFTSIDPMYQIRTATEVFGPVGQGWTYQAEYEFHESLVVCYLTLQFKLEGDPTPCSFGPIMGMEEWKAKGKDGRERIDTDAGKKALTDALTKGLSHLGFNADVFLGMFDDQKYVSKMRMEAEKSDSAKQEKLDQDWADDIITKAGQAQSIKELDPLKAEVKSKSSSVGKGAIQACVAAIVQAETKLTDSKEKDNG